jgi:hypothetical protein
MHRGPRIMDRGPAQSANQSRPMHHATRAKYIRPVTAGHALASFTGQRRIGQRRIGQRNRPAHKKSPAIKRGNGAGSKGAINNLHNTCLHTHPTLHELPHNLGSNWGTRSNHRRYLLNHKNKERFYKNNRDINFYFERRFLFCFYT